MKSDTLAQLLATLGVTQSFSRPHVSDDNAFSEAQFKTLKYQPDYPGLFASELHGRGWLQDFFGWHNDEHHHSGLALFTPADVFYGRVEAVRAVRQAALDAAYQAHPERFSHGPPRVPMPPTAVHINPLVAGAVSVAFATAGSPAETSGISVGDEDSLARRAPHSHATAPGGPDLPTRTQHISTPHPGVMRPKRTTETAAMTELRLQ
jgi:putative transposase